MKYDPKALEAKWQERWSSQKLYHTPDAPKNKYYVLEMFAYPSGDIHMGHFRNYSIGDAVARYRMMRGDDVPVAGLVLPGAQQHEQQAHSHRLIIQVPAFVRCGSRSPRIESRVL